MKHSNNLLTSTFIMLSMLAISNVSFAQTHDDWTINYPGNVCRAAVENQDGFFRIFGDRYKNIGASPYFLVCPVHIHSLALSDETDVDINVRILNEGTSAVAISCTILGYQVFGGPYTAGSPALTQNTSAVAILPGQVSSLFMTLNDFTTFGNQYTSINMVCGMEPGTAIVNLTYFDADATQP